jgi:hypothetical protein
MAKMIPSVFDASNPSPAEGKIFDLLRNDPATADWVVLHSLGLAKRATKPYGEVDFVVLVPGHGAFCLEVKGGRVSCNQGRWQTIDRDGTTHFFNRSPFIQAREGMFAVRDAVLNRTRYGFPVGMIFGYAVVMPDIVFDIISPEWESCNVIDRKALANPISDAILKLSARMRQMFPKAPAKEPSAANVGTIQQVLRPDFEIVVTRGAEIDETELHIRRLTVEQYDGLDVLEVNPRCIAEGAAGTGKTMLAVEHAKRCATMGRRTILVCSNDLLGAWLAKSAAEAKLGTQLVAGAFVPLVRAMILRSSHRKDFLAEEQAGPPERVLTDCFPYYAELAATELGEQFDVLVVDEAQDLLNPSTFPIFSILLRNRMQAGNWAVFGDFHRQAINSDRTADELRKLLTDCSPGIARVPLRTNCRNTRNIGEETAVLSGFDSPPYRLGQSTGLPVDYHYHADDAMQAANFTSVIKRLLADGIKASDIMVLSPLPLAQSGIRSAAAGEEFRLIEVEQPEPPRSRLALVRFATAKAFKGMESSVVVLCDVAQINDSAPQSLLYVAMSRARAHLTVLLHEQAKPHMTARIRKQIEASFNKSL